MNAEQAVTWWIGEAAEREGWRIVDGVVMKPCPAHWSYSADEKNRTHGNGCECKGTELIPAGVKP